LTLGAAAWLASLAQAQTISFTNLWNLGTGAALDYLATGNTERGVAVNPVTGHVLVVSRAGGLKVVVLDGQTGVEVSRLDVTGISGGTFALSTIAVADDGVIYAANLVSPSADTRMFTIYRWADEAGVPTIAYQGNPSNGQRYGDSLDVRGAGLNTQIAAGTANNISGVRFSIFTTADGQTFVANNFSPPTGVTAAAMQKGITFGPGDTVLGKINGSPGKHASFDLATGTSAWIRDLAIVSAISPIDYDPATKLLAGVDYATHQLVVYDASDLAAPIQLSAVPFAAPATANGNGVGAVDFGAGKLVGLDTNNGLVVMGVEVSMAPEAPKIIAEPANQNVLEGANVQFTVGASGSKPLYFQWVFNAQAIPNATNAILTLNSVTTNAAGAYSVTVTNVAGSVSSTPASLTVRPLVKSGRLVKLWEKAIGDLQFLANDNMHRGLAYNPATANLVVASRTLGDTNVYVLDAATGALKHRLQNTDATGVNVIFGGIYALNLVGVAEDGAVYACNLSTSGTDFTLYRWDNDGPEAYPAVAYGPGNPDLVRCGDAMAVRGVGVDTQVLVSSRNGKKFAVFTTTDGYNFTPNTIEVTDATDGNFGLGVAFSAGDTFWGKASGASLRKVGFDLAAGTATSLADYANDFPGAVGPVGALPSENLLAGVCLDTPDNVQLYDVSDPQVAPVLLQQEVFPTDNPNLNGTGAVAFGGGRLFALDSNNGIVAFRLTRPATPPMLSQPVLLAGNQVRLSLTADIGRTYVLRSSANLRDWTTVATQTADASPLQITASTDGAPYQFYRVFAQP
jgi:hypothetical protein